MVHKEKRFGTVRSVSPESHTFEFVANSGQVDRVGEALLPEGCDATNWKANPIILWAHDDYGLPVAKGTAFDADPEFGLVTRGLWASEVLPFAGIVEALYDKGFLNGFSVRFIPRRWEDFNEGSEEFRTKGLRRVYREWELLEISVVDIPCDPRALRKAFDLSASSLEAEDALRKMLAAAVDLSSGTDDLGLSRTFSSSSTSVSMSGTGVYSDNGAWFRDDGTPVLNETMTKWLGTTSTYYSLEDVDPKSAVPYKKFPLADESMPWGFSASDGDALVERGGWKLFASVHSWKDPDVDPETKAAYKLPVAKVVDGSVRVVWRGVAAAMSRLLGGAKIPEADKKAVYNRLARYYEDFDKPAPEFKVYDDEREAVLASFAIERAGELVKVLESGCGLDLEADGLRAILEGSDEKSAKDGEDPGAGLVHIFGPDADRQFVEVLEGLRTVYPETTGKDPNGNDGD
jgi:phage head maturation protease